MQRFNNSALFILIMKIIIVLLEDVSLNVPWTDYQKQQLQDPRHTAQHSFHTNLLIISTCALQTVTAAENDLKALHVYVIEHIIPSMESSDLN